MSCHVKYQYLKYIVILQLKVVRTALVQYSLFINIITVFVYVIVWVAVVIGINCVSSTGRKLVIVGGAAKHYYCFLPALREQLIQNTTVTSTVTN